MAEYKIINGILHCGHVPVFALGASYYPSFLPSKYQVPEDGDRIGEMKKDLHRMKESGLNFFRTAALADISQDERKELSIRAEFVDSMLEEALRTGLAASVRLNGYSVNLSGNTDFEFINNRNEPMEKTWSAFMHGSLHHQGFLKDNRTVTRALAAHFDQFPAVVSFQIYNEPHYPFNGVYDYHPDAIAAYKKYLVRQGVMSEEEAQRYQVPMNRPSTADGIEDWIRWRLFSMKSMSKFLDDTARNAQLSSHDKDTYTCYTTAACTNLCANLGVTYFDDAHNLTTTGITNYTPFDGADYFPAAYTIALAESSATVQSKRAWTVEMDKRTRMPSSKFYRETYEAIGAGHKGICYYEWRGDYPDPEAPLPDNCGFLHYDGRPTQTFETDLKLLALINEYSTELVTAEKVRSHLAILHSDRAYMYYDAFSDPEMGGKNMWIYLTLMAFRDIKKCGFSPDIIRSCDLAENKLGVKWLFIPSLDGLSEEELSQIREFCKSNSEHKAFYGEQITTFDSIVLGGWRYLAAPPANRVTHEFSGGYEMEDLLETENLKPLVETNHKNLFAHTLQGNDRKIVVLVSNRPDGKSIPAHTIRLRCPAMQVTYRTPVLAQEIELPYQDGTVALPELHDGALLFIR